MTFPLAFARGAFCGLDDGWAYFDNAGGTQILEASLDAMAAYLRHSNVQTGGTYPRSQAAADALASHRAALARLIGASEPEEVVFTPSTTGGFQLLARALAPQFAPGDEVILTVFDHESNIGPWQVLGERGVTFRFWALDPKTRVPRLEDLDALLGPKTRLVAVTWASNILGQVMPLEAIGERVQGAGAQLAVDAVAYAPHRRINVARLPIDYLAFSLYKTFGPHQGVLWGRRAHLEALPPQYHHFIDAVPKKLEPGNPNYELAAAAAAITPYLEALGQHTAPGVEGSDALDAAFDAIAAHEGRLSERLLAYLRSRPDADIVGGTDGLAADRLPIISFRLAGWDAGAVARAVEAAQVAVRYGDFHARRLIEHLGLAGEGGVVRVSFAHYNTPEEVDRLIQALSVHAPPKADSQEKGA
jgi:cysteine desulfurase family protein (TIGR01976 family)